MKNYLLGVALATTAVIGSPAAAQTSESDAGARFEFLTGFDRVSLDLGDLGIDDSIHDDGVTFGAVLGYDFAMGKGMLAGIDLEASESTIHEGDSTSGSISVNRDFYAGGRLSFPVGARSKLYVKAGYSNLRVKAELGSASESDNLDGWRIGAGGQIIVAGQSYIGAEYRYSNYQSDVSRNQIVATLGTRF